MKFYTDEPERRIELPKEKIEDLMKLPKEEYFRNAESERKKKEEGGKKKSLEKNHVKKAEKVKTTGEKAIEKEEKVENKMFNILYKIGLLKRKD